jgi:dolichyl-phosphate beta-glucosyltransferase
MEISVVIPAFNEANRIAPTLRRVEAFMDEHFPEHELILVDDGSSDGTAEVAENSIQAPLKVIRNEWNLGKGSSVKKGMMAAQGRMILFSDSDLSTPIEELLPFVKVMEKGGDVVIASRNAEGANKEVKQPLYRQLLGKGFPLIVRVLGLGNFSDTQCGFKLFRKEVAHSILPLQRTKGFAFDVELLFLARHQGFRIEEIGVKWVDKEESKVTPVRDGLAMFGELFRIRWRQWTGGYRKDPSR